MTHQFNKSRKNMANFANKYRGERAFIIGNGPSLNSMDLTKLKNEITFGVNCIFYFFDQMGFKPTFYVVENKLVAEDRAEEINTLSGMTKIFGSELEYCLENSDDVVWANVIYDFSEYAGFPHFSKDASTCLWVGGTVSYLCMQLAYYMGFKEVYLVGFDHNYTVPDNAKVEGTVITSTSDDPNHFHPEYFGKGRRWHDPQLERMEKAYLRAKEVFEENGRKIYNATAEGKLKIFPYQDYDSLFTGQNKGTHSVRNNSPSEVPLKYSSGSTIVFNSDNERLYSVKKDDLKRNSVPLSVAPRFSHLVLDYTRLCDSKCTYCGIWKMKGGPELSLDAIEGVFSSLRSFGLSTCYVTGGEPYISDKIVDIARLLRQHLPNCCLSGATNGVHPRQILKRIQKILRMGVPLEVHVSINGSEATHDATRGRAGFWKNAVYLLDTLKSSGVQVVASMSLMPQTIADLPYMQKFCTEKGVRLMFSWVRQSPRYGTVDEQYSAWSDAEKNMLRQLEYLPDSFECPGLSKRLVVTPAGDVYPCEVYHPEILLGNVHKESLDAMLNSSRATSIAQMIAYRNCFWCQGTGELEGSPKWMLMDCYRRNSLQYAYLSQSHPQAVNMTPQESKKIIENLLTKKLYRHIDQRHHEVIEIDYGSKIFISVVVCTHRNPGSLINTLDSLNRQTLNRNVFEVIVVDNNSQDNTKEIVSRYPSFRYVLEEELGLSHARNAGIRTARGNIVAFIDDDAEASPEWVEALFKVYDTVPEAWAVGGKVLPIWDAEKPEWLTEDYYRSLSLVEWGKTARPLHWPERIIGTNCSFKRKVFTEIAPFDTSLGRIGSAMLGNEDTEIQYRIHSSGHLVYYTPDALVYHHVPASRMTKEYFQQRSQGTLISERIINLRSQGKEKEVQQIISTIKHKLYLDQMQQITITNSIKALRQFKDKHRGQRCVIIGNGPSLNQMDLSFLKDEITFGMNRIYLMFDKYDFRPTYYVSVNSLVIKQSVKDILKIQAPKFLSLNAIPYIHDHSNIIFLKSLGGPSFIKDPCVHGGLYEGYTVTYVAMQLAYFMGFNEVILIGVDHHFQTPGRPNQEVVSNEDDPNHFHPRYFGKGVRWNLPDLKNSEISYGLAKKAFEANGRRIIDATLNGKLNIFPKENYKDLFGKYREIDQTNKGNLSEINFLNQQGEELFNKSDNDGALIFFTKAIEISPNFASAHNNLGVVFHRLGKGEQALAHYRKACTLVPDNTTYQKNLADFYCVALGEIEKAMELYVSVLRKDPRDAEALRAMGRICQALGRTADAQSFFQRAQHADPQDEKAPENPAQLSSPLQSRRSGFSTDAAVNGQEIDHHHQYLVSAIVSTYNAERFIRGCLENIINQTIADQIEIIVIDSGSEQDERRIVAEFQQKHTNIIYLRTARETLYSAWNRAIKLASGKYIAIANTDDRHKVDAFEKMAHILEKKAVGLVYSDLLLTSTPNETFENTSSNQVWQLPNYSLRQALTNCPFGANFMWRREVHDTVGYFDENYTIAGDYEFFLRLSRKYGAYHINELLALYFESSENISYQNPGLTITEINRFIGRNRLSIPMEEIYPFLIKDQTINARTAAFVDFANHISFFSVYPGFHEAITYYRKAIQCAGEDPRILNNLGLSYYHTGQTRQATRLLNKAAAKNAEAQFNFTELFSGKPKPTFKVSNLPYSEIDKMSQVWTRHPKGLLLKEYIFLKKNSRALADKKKVSTVLKNNASDKAENESATVSVHNYATKPYSLLWHAPIYDPSGYADEARHFLQYLHQSGFRISARTIGNSSAQFKRQLHRDERQFYDRMLSRKIDSNYISIIHFPAYAFKRVPQASYHIGRTMFETDSLPKDWVEKCNLMDEIWIPSEFNRQTFKKAGVKKPLVKVPGGIDTKRFSPGLTPIPIQGVRDTVFLSIFTWQHRKGWDILLRAWAETFHKDDNVTLVLRTSPLQVKKKTDSKREIEARIDNFLHSVVGMRRNQIAPIIIIAEQIPENQLPNLFAAANAYVAPSRGEGWGRPQMMAMACGLPVLATNWGGNLEFMHDDNSLLIDVERMCKIEDQTDIAFFRGQQWAEPSWEHLRILLRKVVEKPHAMQALGEKARDNMVKQWTWEMVASCAAKRLQTIDRSSGKPIKSPANHSKAALLWEGSQFVHHSLALVNRELCLELAKREDIELSLAPYEPHQFDANEDPQRFAALAERFNTQLTRPAQFHVRHMWPPNFDPPPDGHWIMIQPWEYGSLPKDWIHPMQTLVDEIWVPSHHVRNVYIKSGVPAEKVFVVPNGVNFDLFNPQATELALDTAKTYKLLFVGGTIWRKGIDLLLDAYTQAFSADDDICLVIKDMGSDTFYKGQGAAARIDAIRQDPTAPEILYLKQSISSREIPGLYRACDCLVHPYRGEGFGLPVAEAMACGLPVIVTRGGACDDFCCEKTVYFVNATRTPVQVRQHHLAGQGWVLEPDKGHLIDLLKHVYTHRDEAYAIGTRAAAEIRQRIGWDQSARMIIDRLAALRHTPILRFKRRQRQAAAAADTAEALYLKVQESLKNQDIEKAQHMLTDLAGRFPDFAPAHNDLGVCYHNRGELKKALAAYRKAINLEPGNTTFQKNLADFYCVALGKIEAAMEIYVNVLRQDPFDIESLLAMGYICRRLERFEDAESFYMRVLEIDPGNETARRFMEPGEAPETEAEVPLSAEAAYEQLLEDMQHDSVEAGIAKISAFLTAFPDLARAHGDIGALYHRAGDTDNAEKHLEKAVALAKDNPQFFKNLADFYLVERDQKERALGIYRQLLEKDPDSEQLLLLAGHICVALKRLHDAADFYRRLLSKNPDNTDARANLEAIERTWETPGKKVQASTETRQSKAPQEPSDNPDVRHNPTPADGPDGPQVSILIATPGPVQQLRRCVQAVEQHTDTPHEILFIDSGITRGTAKWLRGFVSENAHCRRIRCAPDANPATAFNAGLDAASGRFIVLLATDVQVTPQWLSSMLAHLKRQDNTGIVGAMSNVAAKRQKAPLPWNKDEGTLTNFATAYRQRNRHRRIPVDTIDGFCMLFSRQLFENIGPFDEELGKGGYDGEDFCLRATLAGCQNLIAGDVYLHRHLKKKPPRDKRAFTLKWSGADVQTPEGKRYLALLTERKARRAWQAERVDEAGELFLQAIGLQPENCKSYHGLAEMLIQTKQYENSLEVLNELPKGAPDTREMVLEARCAEGLGRLEEAQQLAARALEINPSYAPALNLKGILAFRHSDRHNAASWFERAMTADPGFAEAYSNFGALKWQAGEKDAALDFYERAFILEPSAADIAANYHVALAELNQYDRAVPILREATAIYPSSKKVRYMLIDCLVHLQQYAAAMETIESAIADFGVEDGILASALKVREILGPLEIKNHDANHPTVSLCMIVKNEEKLLANCLRSVKPVVDEIIVVDTGSGDTTKDIAKIFGARVFDHDWQNDFAAARNLSLSKAKGHTIFIMDADEVLSPRDYENFRRFAERAFKEPTAFLFTTRNYVTDTNLFGWMENDGSYAGEERGIGWMGSDKTRLFPNRPDIAFCYQVHELIEPSLDAAGVPRHNCPIPIHHYGKLDLAKAQTKKKLYYQIGREKLDRLGDNPAALRELAIQAETLDKHEEAIDLWEKLITIDPKCAGAYVGIGISYCKLNRYDRVVETARQALQLEPQLKEARYNFALGQFHLGNLDETQSVLKELTEEMPGYLPALFILAAAYCCNGARQEGIRLFKKLSKTVIGAGLPQRARDLAKRLMSSNKPEYATAILQAVIDARVGGHEEIADSLESHFPHPFRERFRIFEWSMIIG